MAYFLLMVLTTCLIQGVRAADCKSSTVGREFVFGILDMVDNCCHDKRNIIAVDITNVSPKTTQVRLQIPYFGNDTYLIIPSGEKKTIIIPPAIQKDSTFKGLRGIKVTSIDDISVLVINAFNSTYTIDVINILPVSALGYEYIISSYRGFEDINRGSAVLVAAAFDNTSITIFNGTDVLQTTILNEYEIFQYICADKSCDLTGSRLVSDKIAYIVAGSTFTAIPFSYGGRDYVASEMLPNTTLSYNYIVAPVLPKRAFMIRILSDESIFDVTISNTTRTYTVKPSFTEQYFGIEAVVATANRPFSVTQYGVKLSDSTIFGEPFMTVVPAVEQFINSYKFSVPHGYYGHMKHYVALIVPKMQTAGLVIDGKSIQSYNTTRQIKIINVPRPLDNYTILTFQIDEGYHSFHHSLLTAFGVFVYGHGNSLSYGFYAGYDLKGDCSTQTSTVAFISTLTPKALSMSTSRSMSTTLSQPASTHSPTSYLTTSPVQTRGHICYNCEDLSHIDLCDIVKQCSEHEVCFVERYVDGGRTKYKTGCIEQNTCESRRKESMFSDALCIECCHDDYCNNKGCGENGIPDRDRRGPICFDCQHVASVDECVKISPCDYHQVCRIEEYIWFDHSHFKLGCGHGLCDPISRVGSHVFKRATPVCHSCCTEDYCNRNCSTSSTGQTGSVIVG